MITVFLFFQLLLACYVLFLNKYIDEKADSSEIPDLWAAFNSHLQLFIGAVGKQ